MDWITSNWGTVSVSALLLWRIADVVARLTPTNKDNEIVDTVGRIIKTLVGKK